MGRPPSGPFDSLRADFPAGVVVFLVALPLCLGIALASDAPPMAGLVTGIVGGLVVAWASGSALAVSGPAAGLTVIVVGAIETLTPEGGTTADGYAMFVAAVVIAGFFQILLGTLRAGLIGLYFPSTVIKGMLAGIGAILVLKQIPHMFGDDSDPEGDMEFVQVDDETTFSELFVALSGQFEPAAVLIGFLGLALLIVWPKLPLVSKQRIVPAPLVVVVLGTLAHELIRSIKPDWALSSEHLVNIKLGEGESGFSAMFTKLPSPKFGAFKEAQVWVTGLTIAIVASIETLLCVDAVDKLDPERRQTPLDRELMAQGAGNMIAGALGGLPMTAVIVRGSANVQAGAKSRLSSFVHGLFLLVAVGFAARFLNRIPNAALAAILLHVGYKLATVRLFREMYGRGTSQFVPFVVTFLAILFTDLLIGVGVGLLVGLGFIAHESRRQGVDIEDVSEDEEEIHEDGRPHKRIRLGPQVTFLNKAAIRDALDEIPDGSWVDVDGRDARFVDPDVVEMLEDYRATGEHRNVRIVLQNVPGIAPEPVPEDSVSSTH